MEKSLLRLFKSVQVPFIDEEKTFRSSSLLETIKYGYVLHPSIAVTPSLINNVNEVLGISNSEANASFHKSWKTVRDSSDLTLVMQQLIHYLTTYGFEKLGIYREGWVYIPKEVLELPNSKNNRLIFINALTKEEVLAKIIFLGKEIALSEQSLSDIMEVVEFNNYPSDFIGQISNRELKTRLYKFYGLVPSDPVEYLRFVVNELTKNSLLIKDRKTIELLKNCDSLTLDYFIGKAPKDLASIFYRFKPLFLAMKHASKHKSFFNRLRREAKFLHKPFEDDYMNTVTSQIKNDNFDLEVFSKKLEDINVYRKIRLANTLFSRQRNTTTTNLYKIRNGKMWVSELEKSFYVANQREAYTNALSLVLESIANHIRAKNIKQSIYIPKEVKYALPTSEKQFVGNIPVNSFVSLGKNALLGIHWYNMPNCRVDLDFSLLGADSKIGWDARCRTGEVWFSGDVTSAPSEGSGASEMFFFYEISKEAKLAYVNFFNHYNSSTLVPYKFFLAQEDETVVDKHYMVDVKNIIFSTSLSIGAEQQLLGMLTSSDYENRFYFLNNTSGNRNVSRNDEINKQVLEHFEKDCENVILLETVLRMAGLEIVYSKPEEGTDYIDLSPEVLDKTTILNLLQ